MVNIILLEGKIISINKENRLISLEVIRNYRNEIGDYDSDQIKCQFWQGINNNIENYLNIDDTILVKGRLEFIDKEYIVMVDSYSLIHRVNKKMSAI